MSQPIYTEIPDTSDNTYWMVTQNQQERSSTFVPRDKDLHRELKQKARKLSQSTSSYKDRRKKD